MALRGAEAVATRAGQVVRGEGGAGEERVATGSRRGGTRTRLGEERLATGRRRGAPGSCCGETLAGAEGEGAREWERERKWEGGGEEGVGEKEGERERKCTAGSLPGPQTSPGPAPGLPSAQAQARLTPWVTRGGGGGGAGREGVMARN